MNLSRSVTSSLLVVSAFALLHCASRQPTGEAVAPSPAGSAPPLSASAAPGTPGGSGPRPEPGGACGGIAGARCAAGSYCDFAPEAQCGAADQMGTCRPVPEMCTEQYAPVCGCDDRTYPNACAAARASVSVIAQGECATAAGDGVLGEGQLCGTRGVPGSCAADSYCKYARQCGADDSGGVCTKKTAVCTRIYAPVCGCDGKTYGNECTAASEGVSVAAVGECAKSQ